MLYVIIILGLFFVGIGFILTEANAKYLLAGYNTMPEKERQKVDLIGFLTYFKRFHIGLGLSFILFGLSLYFFVGENASGIFIGVYPIVAYIYFLATSRQYSQGMNESNNRIGITVLLGSLVLVIGLFVFGVKEDVMHIDAGGVKIEGLYGVNLRFAEIKTMTLVEELPEIHTRLNGFSLGDIRKGYFKAENGERLKLILNSRSAPYIFLETTDGQQIFFNTKDGRTSTLFEQLNNR